ncbi:MAG: PEGA domain-containing protein [Planctomycetota bacterium]|nr:PEGA domain-containing protein [Planctomycetota bacterium]
MGTGCATIVNGSRQNIAVNSSPSGATVIVDGKPQGSTPWIGKIERRSRMPILIQKEGYEPVTLNLDGEMSGWFLGNFICGGLLGATTDLVSGGVYVYSPDSYHVTLREASPVRPTTAALPPPSNDRVSGDGKHADRKAKIKRYCLMYYKDIGRDITKRKGEHLAELMQFMNVSVPAEVFAESIKQDYVEAESPDAFAERMILKAKYDE